MTLIYHGTSFETSIDIAKAGAILSPLEQEKQIYLKSLIGKKVIVKDFLEGMSTNLGKNFKTLEDFVLYYISDSYGEYEIEHRVKCVSFHSDKDKAKDYALGHSNGGIVFGLDLSVDKVCKGSNGVVFIPGKASLDNLKEVWFTSNLNQENRERTMIEFMNYNPYFLHL